MIRAAAIAAVALCAACEGEVGLVSLTVVSAPGVDPLADAQRVRITVDNPPRVVEAERDGDGFSLALEITAEGQATRVLVEGFDADGDLVATGRTGLLPIGPIDGDIAVYLAAPGSLAEAPVALPDARAEFQAVELSFGALFAGGRDGTATPVDDVAIYNVYQHELQIGEPLPEPRAQMTAVAGFGAFVYMFGGIGTDGEPAGTFWRFDTSQPPAGFYVELEDDPALARAGADAAPIGAEVFLATGDPGLFLDGAFSTVAPVEGPPLSGQAAALIVADNQANAFIAGDGVGSEGAVVYDSGVITDLTGIPGAVARSGHAVVRLPSADALVIAGADPEGTPLASAAIYRRAEQRFDVVADVLATPRTDAAVAVSRGRVVVAGGTDEAAAIIGDAEILDATTLERIAIVPMVVPRTGAVAAVLDNGQILIAGGYGADGEPVATLELFTP